MSERHINLINGVYTPPRKPTEDIESPPTKKTRLIYRVLILILIILILFFTNIIFSRDSLITNLGRLSFWEGVARLMVGKDKILKGELSDRINILILGMGGAEHEGPFLTDTIILASLKPSTSQLGLLSIPRDLYVPVPNYGWRKINSANALGMIQSKDGGVLTSQVVENILDLNIHYWVRVDFNLFKNLIDELGGIKVEVEKGFIDYQFPGPNFSYRPVIFEAGLQLMDGQKALEFVRSRHGNNEEGSDFARAKRQQKILFALKKKAAQENLLTQPQKIWRFYNILKNNVSSNLDISQSIKLAKLISQINENKITTKVITVGENGLLKEEINIDGAYILKTKSGNFKNLAKLAREMFKSLPFQEQIVFGQRVSGLSNSTENLSLNQEPVLTSPEPKIIILNGTYINGLAKQTSKKLNAQNLTVIKIGNAPTRNYEKTIIYNSANEFDWSKELNTLKTILKTDIINDIPEELKFILNTNQADFLIIVGNEQ